MALNVVNSVRVSATVLEGLGLLTTAWRVYFRFKIRRFWWEDTWAVMMLFAGLLWVPTQWTSLLTSGLMCIVSSWIYSIGYTCVVAFARISILFSIIRIIHGNPRLLKFTHACAAFFVTCWVILIAERVWQCASNPNWHKYRVPSVPKYCVTKYPMLIFDFITECVAVLLLVVLPLRMLWRVKLSKRRRRMILCVFASSVVLALAALFHMLGRVFSIYVVIIAGMNVEVTLSLFVCNLLVVVTYAYRYCNHRRSGPDTAEDTTELEDASSSHEDDFSTPIAQMTTMHLTTIDLAIHSESRTTYIPESV